MAASYGYSFAAVEGWARRIALVLGVCMMAALIPGQGAQAEATIKPLKVVVLGDSLTAGYGLPAADAFPAKLQKALKAKGIETEMVNAGVSGDTASGGLARLDWSVPPDADAVIVELGANDALRGTDPKVPRKALDEILKRLQQRKMPVLLAGMLAPPNFGKDYAAQFNAIYPELAATYDVPLYPFFLDGVAAVSNLNQPDGIHPTAAGVDVIVERILPMVEALLRPLLGQRS